MNDLRRRVAAEALGTALLLFVIVGSGIATERLGTDGAGQLLAHAIAVGFGLAALIAFLGPVSGAHFNPAVTLGFWRTSHISGRESAAYVVAQLAGAVVGVMAANWTFDAGLAAVSQTTRNGAGVLGSELVATFVLVLLILGLVRAGNIAAVAPAVGGWVAAAIFATSSTGFANPAVTVARTLTDTYAGIAPASVPAFVAVQLAAALLAAAVAVLLFPVTTIRPDRVTTQGDST